METLYRGLYPYDDPYSVTISAALRMVADLNDPAMQETAFKKLCGEKLAAEKVPQVFEFSSRMRVAATGKKTKSLNPA